MYQGTFFNELQEDPFIAITEVLQALKSIRMGVVKEEQEIHKAIMQALDKFEIGYKHEYKLASRNRIDFLAAGGIGIEVKKGKPNASSVINQLERYSGFPEISGIILVVERYQDLPRAINGKPCKSLGLRKLWGIVS